ncbi:MAG: hypothetical protein AABZ57_06700 [Candidatus Margulisiibacteriota bacterium]
MNGEGPSVEIDKLLDEVEAHKQDTDDNLLSEEAKADRDNRAKKGIEAQQEPPEREKKQTQKQKQMQTRRVQPPQR